MRCHVLHSVSRTFLFIKIVLHCAKLKYLKKTEKNIRIEDFKQTLELIEILILATIVVLCTFVHSALVFICNS